MTRWMYERLIATDVDADQYGLRLLLVVPVGLVNRQLWLNWHWDARTTWGQESEALLICRAVGTPSTGDGHVLSLL